MVKKKSQKGGVGFSFDLSQKIGGLPQRKKYSECPKKNNPGALYGQAGGKKKSKKSKKVKKSKKTKKAKKSKKFKKTKKSKK